MFAPQAPSWQAVAGGDAAAQAPPAPRAGAPPTMSYLPNWLARANKQRPAPTLTSSPRPFFPQLRPGVRNLVASHRQPSSSTASTMFSRVARITRAVPARAAPRAAVVPSFAARRAVTTNAATAQVDKSSVPQVRRPLGRDPALARAWWCLAMLLARRVESGRCVRADAGCVLPTSPRMSPSRSLSAMRALRPTSSTPPPTTWR